ncbi:ABC transporter substrate-binding protein [Sporosarcina sp. ANT_H38]|uniref:ABC transporter substrate-binding protein n=1 Tax=Sporosarcina sp. ANT_H38 TaxID=2597358 RepID=UPI0011F30F16|nr:ABC transporter substrate-binding protein [Sporosarcina sp. ANT_H38]KAA0942100.1 ABC transporter substrate-binding protein [Sporosarcina sp. ANT_H38]
MDKHLLTLWSSVPSGNIKQKKLADVLSLSTKQTARYIQKWSTEGWLTFNSGLGRGNVSTLLWLKNVEAVFEEHVTKLIDEEPVELSSKYLLLDWSTDCKQRLMNTFHSKFGYLQTTNDKLVVRRKYPFLTIHPLKAADVNSANLVANIFNRLVAVDEKGIVLPELAHSWDITPTKIRFYLKKDIRFHDGSILTAEDVVICLNKLRSYPQFQDLWAPVKSISVPAPLVIDICFPSRCSYCLHMLGTMNASIYKENNGDIFGTGCFYVQDNNDLKTTLVAFKDYFGERPLLDLVEFVQVPHNFEVVYSSSTQTKDRPTFQVESDSGFGVVIMNSFRNTPIRRKEIRDYVHYVIAKHRHEISKSDARILPNHQGCLIGQSQTYVTQEVKRPDFSVPLILKIVNYTEKTTMWIKDVLEKEGIPIEVKWVSFMDTIYDDTDNLHVDLFIHGEIFDLNQNFSFFHFLKNGYSPLATIMKIDKTLSRYLTDYALTPFDDWSSLNLKVEKALLENSIMIPLYYAKRQIPFSADLMNINIKHFGYVDFSKLWVQPNIEPT